MPALLSVITFGCGSEVFVRTPSSTTSGSASASSGVGGAMSPTPCEDGVGPWEHEDVIVAPVREVSNFVRDEDGQLHAFTAGAYIRGRAGSWTIESVPYSTACSHGTEPSLTIDDEGHAHVACGMYHWMYKTEYWTNQSGRWLKTMLPPGGDGGPASLAIAPDGTPHVIYLNYPSGQYVHGTLASGGWTFELLAAKPANEDRAAIAFGPTGQLWIAFMKDAPGGVQTLALGRIDQAANFSQVDLAQYDHAAFVGGIAVDDAGVVHVTYSGDYTKVYYGQLDGDDWVARWLNDGQLLSGKHTSPKIALDATGKPSLALTRSVDDVAIFLRKNGKVWEPESIGSSRREVTSLAIDEVGAAHVLSIKGGDGQGDRLLYSTNRRNCPSK